jgi:hypothetical protein
MLKRTAVAALTAALTLTPLFTHLDAQSPAVISGPVGPSPYNVIRYWQKPFSEPGFAFGGNSGVFAESPDRIFIAQRGETRLPDPLPACLRGFCRLHRNQCAQRHRPPRDEKELSLHARCQWQRARTLVAMGPASSPMRRGRDRTAFASALRSAASRVGGRRDLQRHLRLLQRRQQTAEDARREGRAGHRTALTSASLRTWHFFPTAGYSSPTVWITTAS